MAFLDADEFIFPRENSKSIVEIVDEVLSSQQQAAGLAINWHIFGSSGQEKADLSKGVLERFIYRSKDDFDINEHIKTIANPRCMRVIINPHFVSYFDGKFTINENSNHVPLHLNKPCSTLKIGINHYFTKSKEEFINKRNRGKADLTDLRDMSEFDINDKNDVYDDSILTYREARKNALKENQKGGRYNLETPQQIDRRRLNTLIKIFSPLTIPANLSINSPPNLFSNKLHIFLTCLNVSSDLKGSGLKDDDVKYFEELSLKCVQKSLSSASIEVWQMQLLIDELPKILNYQYPVVGEIKESLKNFIPQIMNIRRKNNHWDSYKQLNYLLQILQRLE